MTIPSAATALAAADADALGALSPAERGIGDARVLLVDDSQLIRMGLRRSLEQVGLKNVREVDNGMAAV